MKKTEMITTKDYHNLYLKWDILLLAEVFEKFINKGMIEKCRFGHGRNLECFLASIFSSIG